MAKLERDSRGFEVRTIQNGQAIGCGGYGIEILDGGFRGGENKLILGRGNYGTDGAYSEDASIRAWPGNKLTARFDYVFLPVKQDSPTPQTDIDTVTCRIITQERAVFTDAQNGLTRKRNLARGITSSIAAGAATKIYESNPVAAGGPYRDDYYTDERSTELGFFDGFVYGDKAFTLWILAGRARNPTTPGTMHPIVAATAQTRTLAAGIADATHVGGFSYNFTWGSTNLTSTVGIPVPYPGGAVEIWIENTDGVSAGIYQYFVGVRGSL